MSALTTSDALLFKVGRKAYVVLALARQTMTSAAEEVRVLATEPRDDPGADHPAPPPPRRGDDEGFDPLPPPSAIA